MPGSDHGASWQGSGVGRPVAGMARRGLAQSVQVSPERLRVVGQIVFDSMLGVVQLGGRRSVDARRLGGQLVERLVDPGEESLPRRLRLAGLGSRLAQALVELGIGIVVAGRRPLITMAGRIPRRRPGGRQRRPRGRGSRAVRPVERRGQGGAHDTGPADGKVMVAIDDP